MENKKQSVLSKISHLKNKKVLIVGDVGLDQYVNGAVKRISPEAPVPVLDVVEEELRLGLSCNVAQNISSLGGEAILISVIGKDEAGIQLRTLLENAKVPVDNLLEDTERPTTKKLRVMSGHHHIVRIDYEKKIMLSSEIQEKIYQKTASLIESCDIVVLQDYAKGVLSKVLCQKIIQLAKKHGKTLLVDPNRNTPISFYEGANLMTPNLDEAMALCQWDPDISLSEDLMELGKIMMDKLSCNQMIITRSQDGMSFFQGNSSKMVPTFARKVSDVTGAGDTVIAAIALALAASFDLEEACVLANYAAGVVVGKIGCVPCYTEELLDYIDAH